MKKIIIAIDGFSSTGKSTIAKQLANKGFRKIWYLWEYGREEFVTEYLKEKVNIEVELYTSDLLQDFVKRLDFHPIGKMHPRFAA